MLIAQRPSLTEEVVDEFRSRFVIEPLEPGFGYTLGNSLRRTLLSSIPGAAVTSIRVDGVLHEFTTVPGVKEDVTDLILNIKQLVVSSEHDEPVVMYLRKQGPGLVTAADIAPPAGVEVHNPDLVLATLNGKGKLEMELTVERGRGYVSAVQNKQQGQEIGRIPVDSIYSPVLKVTYKVEATRVEQRTDFDKLIVDVETKQAMRPRDAMASAGKTLVELFGLARELNVDAEGIDMGPSPTDAALAADLALPIEELELTVRSYNCLKREGIHSVGELVARSEADLLDIRNFGAKSIDEVKAKLAGMGLALKDSPPGFDPTAAADAFGADDDDTGFVGDRAVLTAPTASRGTPPGRDPARGRRTRRTHRYLTRPVQDTKEKHHASARKGCPSGRQRRAREAASREPRASLFEHGRITTTEAKARRLRPVAETLITKAKKGDLHNRRQVLPGHHGQGAIVYTLFSEIAPRYENRPGGYTRITKIGPRRGDNAPMAVIELVEALTVAQQATGEAEAATKRRKDNARTRPEGRETAEAAEDAAPLTRGAPRS